MSKQEETRDQQSLKAEPDSKRNKWMPLIILALILMMLLELFGSTCFFSSVFGIPCAGCGSTRAITFLWEGKLGAALRMHPLILVTLILIVVITTFTIARFIMKKRGKTLRSPLSPRLTNIIFFSLVVLYLATYVIRMILYFPHTEPMVYNHHSVWGRLISFIRAIFTR